MPYIKNRSVIDEVLTPLLEVVYNECGEGDLNYIVTRTVDKWCGTMPSYMALNAAIGILECAKLELYRRIVTPYEDKKLSENGDVYQQRKFKPLPAIELPGKDESK